jgi:ubiquinone/menaquinone biosynthesis C-methylase UbiE
VPTARQLELALAGVALARNWLVGERGTVERIEAEIRRLSTEEPADGWYDVPERSVAEGYPEWAPAYDQPGNPIVQLEGPAMARLFAEFEPGRVLDAACGTGRHYAVLAELGHRVVGVDATEAMLAIARARVPAGEFRIGSLTELPLEDGSVDLAVCSLALTHLPQLGPAVSELARVVRPGGRVLISDVHPLFVALGAQGAYRAEGERAGYVRNYVHWLGAYLNTFDAAGLDARECHELLYRRQEVDLLAPRVDIDAEVVAEALVGLPAVVVWDLARP